MHNKNLIPEAGFIRQSTMLKIFPIGKTTLWNGVKTGRFPKPVKLGGRITAWRVEDIMACIEAYSNGGK
ncbi:MAG: AlpA family phage regulatory protein [Candidatus Midichloriaceae bacterium]|jgi:predicted DNA-binding transcriptional regulator AlpA|nr:AlpA family phage regulatory protein [Candidatus Midichloriaceae bacterium]